MHMRTGTYDMNSTGFVLDNQAEPDLKFNVLVQKVTVNRITCQTIKNKLF